MIECSNPAVGYMANEVFTTYAFTQTIKAGDTLPNSPRRRMFSAVSLPSIRRPVRGWQKSLTLFANEVMPQFRDLEPA